MSELNRSIARNTMKPQQLFPQTRCIILRVNELKVLLWLNVFFLKDVNKIKNLTQQAKILPLRNSHLQFFELSHLFLDVVFHRVQLQPVQFGLELFENIVRPSFPFVFLKDGKKIGLNREPITKKKDETFSYQSSALLYTIVN